MSSIHTGEREIPVIEGYEFESFLGETASTESWGAVQISLDRKVSLLTLKPALLGDQRRVERFEDIARTVARIHHRNIVSVIDITRNEDGLPYVVMERADGVRLSEVLHTERKLPPERAAKIVLQIAEALDAAWKQSGFIHRNIKPENIAVLPDDTAKIVTFMYATIVRPGVNPLEYDDDNVVGTPFYMSPEQIECLRTIDFRADVYSLGAMFYQLLTGSVPFRDLPDVMQVLDGQKNGTIPSPSDVNSSVPERYSRLVQKMMAKKPGDRHAFWQDVCEDIHRVLKGRDPFVQGDGEWKDVPSTVAPSKPKPAGVKKGFGAKKSIVRPGTVVLPANGAKARPIVGKQSPAKSTVSIRPQISVGASSAMAAASVPADGGTRKSTPTLNDISSSSSGTEPNSIGIAAPLDGGTAKSTPVPPKSISGNTKFKLPPFVGVLLKVAAIAVAVVGTWFWRSASLERETSKAVHTLLWETAGVVAKDSGTNSPARLASYEAGIAKLRSFLPQTTPPESFGASSFLSSMGSVDNLPEDSREELIAALDAVLASTGSEIFDENALALRNGVAQDDRELVRAVFARIEKERAEASKKPVEVQARTPSSKPVQKEKSPAPETLVATTQQQEEPQQPVVRAAETQLEGGLLDIVQFMANEKHFGSQKKRGSELPWTQARNHAKKVLSDIRNREPARASECDAIETAFDHATPWHVLVANMLLDISQGGIVPVTINGSTIRCEPQSFDSRNGLYGVLHPSEEVSLSNRKIPIEDMSLSEMYEIHSKARPKSNISQEDLLARAFIVLSMGPAKRGEFDKLLKRHADALGALAPFAGVYDLKRGNGR